MLTIHFLAIVNALKLLLSLICLGWLNWEKGTNSKDLILLINLVSVVYCWNVQSPSQLPYQLTDKSIPSVSKFDTFKININFNKINCKKYNLKACWKKEAVNLRRKDYIYIYTFRRSQWGITFHHPLLLLLLFVTHNQICELECVFWQLF